MTALGKALVAGYQIKRTATPGRFNITSPRGGMYVTTAGECSCPDRQMRGGSYERGGVRYCKHSIVIKELVEFLREIECP